MRGRIAAAAEAAGRDPHDVTLISVSKTHPAEVVDEAVAAGARTSVRTASRRRRPRNPEFATRRWHLIGPLQRNKARARPRGL